MKWGLGEKRVDDRLKWRVEKAEVVNNREDTSFPVKSAISRYVFTGNEVSISHRYVVTTLENTGFTGNAVCKLELMYE